MRPDQKLLAYDICDRHPGTAFPKNCRVRSKAYIVFPRSGLPRGLFPNAAVVNPGRKTLPCQWAEGRIGKNPHAPLWNKLPHTPQLTASTTQACEMMGRTSTAFRASVAAYRCLKCGKAYARSSHLRRHEVTHVGKPQQSCVYCGKAFIKADVLRRHALKCAAKGGQPPPPERKRGRKRHACSRCIHRKLLCDANTPCTNCFLGGYECLYPDSLTPPSPERVSPPHPMNSTDQHENSVDAAFLRRFTDLKVSIPAQTVAAESNKLHNRLPRTSGCKLLSDLHEEPTEVAAHFPEPDNWVCSLFPGLSADEGTFHDILPQPQIRRSLLQTRLDDIVLQLSLTHQSRRSPEAFPTDLARSIFTVQNLKGFAWAFFYRLSPTCPIFHLPTFRLGSTSSRLLLVIFLDGSLVSAPCDDALSARQFFEVAEEYIFDHEIFKHGKLKPGNNEFETLLAAWLMYMMQAHAGDSETRRRILARRHPDFVKVVKACGLLSIRHEFPLEFGRMSDWETFVSIEQWVRLAAWTCLGDCHFNICFNSPLHLDVSDVIVNLPCGKALFDAESAAEFERLAPSERTSQRPTCLRDLIHCLRKDSWLNPGSEKYKSVTVLHLLMAISVLCAHSYEARVNPTSRRDLNQILGMSGHWKLLWDEVIKAEHGEYKSHNCFMEHADELWLLLRMVIKQFQRGESDDPLRERHCGGFIRPFQRLPQPIDEG